MDMLAVFLLFAGFAIGLGAVTVIDLHGFLARKSKYWTVATTRTHKVTKPMIWIGMALALAGGALFHYPLGWSTIALVQLLIAVALVLNGAFLSFSVSPFLLERERQGREGELLPAAWQRKITASFLVSVTGWWSEVLIFAYVIAQR